MVALGVDGLWASSIVGQIYDSVLEPAVWSAVLERVCERTGGCAASLNSHRLPDLAPELAFEHGTSPDYSRSYVETYAATNPLFAATIFEMAEGETRALVGAVDLAAFHRTRFYREWVHPQGWGDWLGSLLTRSSTHLSMLAVARKTERGPFRPDERAYVELLAPHIRRAVELSRLFKPATDGERGLAALVDRFAAAALLVCPNGRIAFANAGAEAMLAERDLFRSVDGRLVWSDEAAGLRARFERLSAGSGGDDVAAVATRRGTRIVSLLAPSERTGGFAGVLIARQEASDDPPGPLLREAFSLTPAELRVLLRLLSGRTLAEVAADLGISHRTVKAHLQNLFAKTETARQSDLIRKVLSLKPPFA